MAEDKAKKAKAKAVSENVEIVRVEWHGQDRIESNDDEGNTIFVEELFQTGVDAEGNPQYLGRMA